MRDRGPGRSGSPPSGRPRSTTGMSAPRRSITPSISAGASGSGVARLRSARSRGAAPRRSRTCARRTSKQASSTWSSADRARCVAGHRDPSRGRGRTPRRSARRAASASTAPTRRRGGPDGLLGDAQHLGHAVDEQARDPAVSACSTTMRSRARSDGEAEAAAQVDHLDHLAAQRDHAAHLGGQARHRRDRRQAHDLAHALDRQRVRAPSSSNQELADGAPRPRRLRRRPRGAPDRASPVAAAPERPGDALMGPPGARRASASSAEASSTSTAPSRRARPRPRSRARLIGPWIGLITVSCWPSRRSTSSPRRASPIPSTTTKSFAPGGARADRTRRRGGAAAAARRAGRAARGPRCAGSARVDEQRLLHRAERHREALRPTTDDQRLDDRERDRQRERDRVPRPGVESTSTTPPSAESWCAPRPCPRRGRWSR